MPIQPTDAEVLETAIRSFLLDVHTCLPAITKAYTASTQRGNFLPVVQGAVLDDDGNNVYELRPIIQNVPVRWERAGGHYDHKPLAAGDHGWLIFSEDSYANWRATGEVSVPGDLTRHSIAYPFFLPGAWPDDDSLPDVGATEGVHIVPAGSFRRFSKAGGSAEFVALANLVNAELQKIATALNSATWPGGAVAAPVVYSSPYTTPTDVSATSLKSD
jgi:hypothetical protein